MSCNSSPTCFKVIVTVLLMLLFQVCIPAQDFSMLDAKLSKYQQQMGNDAVMMIYKNGKVIYLKEMGRFTKDSPERIASSTKWLSAACIMTLVDDGKIKLDDPVAKYLADFRKPGFDAITIRHCLSHKTGLRASPMRRKIASRIRKNSLKEMVADIPENEELYAKPGTSFYYGNIGLLIAGRVAEVVSSTSWAALFEEKIAAPCNMLSTTFSEGGLEMLAGSATSTAADYMRFLQMILDKGTFIGKRVLSERSIQEMQRSQTEGLAIEHTPEIADGIHYGLGEWIMSKDVTGSTTAVASPGLFGCWPLVNLTKGYASILFVHNNNHRGRKEMMKDLQQTIDGLIK
jgi:CubicO group peptidase (beta-lactamase class C family)